MAENDAVLDIKIAENKLKVTASYFPSKGGGNSLTVDDVISRLKSMGVIAGIQQENISAMCLSDRPMRNIIVAVAIQPETGEKAKIISYFDMNGRRKALEKEDGSVDYRNLGEVASAVKGQELYRKVPPTVGNSGKDVMGNEIPGLPGKDIKLILGQGTAADENDTNLIRASIDGEIIVSRGIVQISPIHKIDGDIDYSTGNVKFNGTVKIFGTVKSGFKVEAAGDIEVSGNVEDAEIIGKNDIIILGGYTGNGDGLIQAGRDVIVKFVENQRIDAERDIIINDVSYHAMLSAGRSIIAKGNRSLIVGGQCEAKISIEAKRLGSEAATVTTFKVGVDPKLSEKYQKIEDDIAHTNESLEKLEKSIVFLYRQKIDSGGKFSQEKQELLDKLEKTKKAIPEKLKMLRTSLDNLSKEHEDIEKAYVSADIVVYPKVKVYFGQQWISIDDKLGPSVFQMKKGEVVRLSK